MRKYWVLFNALFVLSSLFPISSFGTEPKLSIACPCSFEQINQTKGIAKFGVIFHEQIESVDNLELSLWANKSVASYDSTSLEIGSAKIPSLRYSESITYFELPVPVMRHGALSSEELFLYMRLKKDESIFSRVALNQLTLTFQSGPGIW